MRISTTGSMTLAAALLATSVYAQNPPNTHAHGTTTVQLVQRNQELVIYVRTPGVDMLGVGRLPINMEEQNKLSQVEGNMRNPAFWIDLPAAAGCNMTRYYPSQHPVIAGRGALQEMSPGKEYKDNGEHMDMNFTYHFHCASPAALDSASIKLFEQFPSIETVNAKVPGRPIQTLSATANVVQIR